MICSPVVPWIDWTESVRVPVLEDGTFPVVVDLHGLTTKNKGLLSGNFFTIRKSVPSDGDKCSIIFKCFRVVLVFVFID